MLKTKCRICLDITAASGVHLLGETILPNINAGLAYQIITGLKIKANDRLSNCICTRCESRLRDAFLLRQLAEKSRKIINDKHASPSATTVTGTHQTVPFTGNLCKKIYFKDAEEVEVGISSDNNSDITELSENNFKIESNTSTISNEKTEDLRVMTREELLCPANEKRAAIEANNFHKNKLQEDNIGYKMLQNLGWQGGSIGKYSDGIEEPVRVEIKRNRHCLGLNRTEITAHYGYQDLFVFMRTFKNRRDSNYVMEFRDEFSEKEKNLLYAVCRRLKLNARKMDIEDGQYALRVSKMTY